MQISSPDLVFSLWFAQSAQGTAGSLFIHFFICAIYTQTDWIIEKREYGINFEVAD